ncbi:hypothetical protein [Streptomyces scabiei]|uniref:hypothetical protein n=1 Tax=Streptomyces scabiei TaxID=1930 RepID=UPI001B31C905|nr:MULTISPECIES: hypothetical protein [Streptomyces]MBP5888825.1 hypothetical protein [Streptomyces sp. LBUM 1481]MBP5918839.1 hypothetical protein [Streptomyces sp. LBUM 1483]MDX2685111.1 hypothetical protein [Streptomyces scabiei]MDX2753374.1 hypothetical protein [Streptomyces scabiei]MDX2807555.1 hypothetical protein [Streptomyces scabiei]
MLALILAGLLTLAAVACSDDEVTSTPATSATSAPAQQTSPTEQPSTPSPTSPAPTAAVRDTVDLTGIETEERLAVTVVKVIDLAQGENQFSSRIRGCGSWLSSSG